MGHPLTWEKGRQLKSFDGITYTYNANGIRTSKTVDGVKHTYILDGTKILKETWGSSSIVPLYDNEDAVCGMIYDNTPYYFHKNLQGDIITITDKNGNGIVGYTYDAWGKCTVTFDVSGCDVATVNPYRYRGYYFDNEIGMYYLQSRYYDANVGRFINGDDIAFICGFTKPLFNNLFFYCNNSSPNFKDSSGYFAITIAAGVTISFGTAVALIALTVFAFAYAFDRNFRNAINQLITMLVQGAIDGIGYLSNVISDIVQSARRSRKHSGNEVHHIVAQSDYRASSSRTLLRNYGISTGSSYNLVTIRKTLHKHLHTNAYHAAVYIVLKSMASKYGSWTTKKYRIIAGLVFIGVLLKGASKLF
jgi:RHS repeat-associated protein